ncbi:MAG: SprT-like domain-containing protein [Candidatus Woesearchaeota archaeon]
MPEDAYVCLFGSEPPYTFEVTYSNRFKPFNARVEKRAKHICFKLSRKWDGIDPDIKKGLYQELLAKLFSVADDTRYMELYRIFVHNMHIAADRIESDPYLVESFNRVNERYFSFDIEMPNLLFGKKTKRTLGSYNFHADTLTISSVLKDGPQEFVDYVMYHELLHKWLKFDYTKRKARHHTSEFKRLEQQFEDYEGVEKRLKRFLNGRS